MSNEERPITGAVPIPFLFPTFLLPQIYERWLDRLNPALFIVRASLLAIPAASATGRSPAASRPDGLSPRIPLHEEHESQPGTQEKSGVQDWSWRWLKQSTWLRVPETGPEGLSP